MGRKTLEREWRDERWEERNKKKEVTEKGKIYGKKQEKLKSAPQPSPMCPREEGFLSVKQRGL